MGGASQGNQGIAFGSRRQITASSPSVPSLAEKQRLRQEKEAEEKKRQEEAAEQERQKRLEQEAEEERERQNEERRWEEETKRQREQERRRLEQQKREWEEQERQWKIEEEARQKEEAAAAAHKPATLNGQFLSQYQAGQKDTANVDTPEQRRVQELEKQLEEARERERQYQLEREQRSRQDEAPTPKRVDSMERPSSAKESEASWAPDDRETLRQSTHATGLGSARPTPAAAARADDEDDQESTRPLPDPVGYRPKPQAPNRTDGFLTHNRAPAFQRPKTHQPAEMGFSSTIEEQTDRDRRVASQDRTKAGAWASKSLLEREMERERERQKEWEANQEATKHAAKDLAQGSAPGQSWNVNQYGYTGGDNQNRGSGPGSGVSIGGRRQILGPRPQPGRK